MKSKKPINKKSIILIASILAVCIAVTVYFNMPREKAKPKVEKEEAVVEEKEEKEEAGQIDFDKLHETNEDIYAWITVPGTAVDYPVLQSAEDEDTDYYLETNLDGTSGLPGCIYTQHRNSKDFNDPDTIIYGHDMKDGSMFNSLHNFEDEQFFSENNYILIYTPEDELRYRIFAAIMYDDRLILDYYSDFKNKDDFKEYISEIYEQQGNIDNEVAVDSNDKLITLSTCQASASDKRFLVIGKLED